MFAFVPEVVCVCVCVRVCECVCVRAHLSSFFTKNPKIVPCRKYQIVMEKSTEADYHTVQKRRAPGPPGVRARAAAAQPPVRERRSAGRAQQDPTPCDLPPSVQIPNYEIAQMFSHNCYIGEWSLGQLGCSGSGLKSL